MTQKRPRNLTAWDAVFHLDGPLGGSLAYTFPVAFALTGSFAPIYLCIIAMILLLVGNGYKIICKHNPDGGGVFSSLRKISKPAAIIGALLIVTDYIATGALSIVDALYYLHLDTLTTSRLAIVWSILIIGILALINLKGPHFSAKFAAVASIPTFFLSIVLAVLALPLVPTGIANIPPFTFSLPVILRNTTSVLLALSGIEAVSNMTGVMKNPTQTSRRAINIEMGKVIFTTVILGFALNAVPLYVVYQGSYINNTFIYKQEQKETFNLRCVLTKTINVIRKDKLPCKLDTYTIARKDTLRALSEYLLPGTLGSIYSVLIGLSYGLLLIFAGNTVLIDMTNISYALAKKGELPEFFRTLNNVYGVPIWGLFFGAVLPIVTIVIFGATLESLASLYALGVVGAITLNLAGTTTQIHGRDRWITGTGALVIGILFITLAVNRMEATLFAAVIVTAGLVLRRKHKVARGI